MGRMGNGGTGNRRKSGDSGEKADSGSGKKAGSGSGTDAGSVSGGKAAVRTGDSSQMAVWIGVLDAAAAGLVLALLIRKRNNR